jgi:hypothetical protein
MVLDERRSKLPRARPHHRGADADAGIAERGHPFAETAVLLDRPPDRPALEISPKPGKSLIV